MDAYISTHASDTELRRTPPSHQDPLRRRKQRMRHKVSTTEGRAIYRRRKCLPEPVFGQIKQAMGFRRFSMRGLHKARGEWALVCMSHNVRRLHAARVAGRVAPTG